MHVCVSVGVRVSECVCACVCVCVVASHVTDRIMTLQRNCVIVNFALIIIVNTLFIFSFLFTN